MKDKLFNYAVFILELYIGIICGLIVAAFVLPLAYSERGYFGIGGEWILIIFTAYVGFSVCHNRLFKSERR